MTNSDRWSCYLPKFGLQGFSVAQQRPILQNDLNKVVLELDTYTKNIFAKVKGIKISLPLGGPTLKKHITVHHDFHQLCSYQLYSYQLYSCQLSCLPDRLPHMWVPFSKRTDINIWLMDHYSDHNSNTKPFNKDVRNFVKFF